MDDKHNTMDELIEIRRMVRQIRTMMKIVIAVVAITFMLFACTVVGSTLLDFLLH